MDYTLSLTRHAAESLRAHLLGDRSREQMAITLCGINSMPRSSGQRRSHELRLLVRDVILLPPDAFRQQTAASLELDPGVQAFIHQRAFRHGLIEVDWHSHPGNGHVAFSHTDDHYEAAQAAYLAERMNGVPYGSVVLNGAASPEGNFHLPEGNFQLDARLWVTQSRRDGETVVAGRPHAIPLQAVLVSDLQRIVPAAAQRRKRDHAASLSPVFDRQVRAFGQEFQRKLGRLRVGLVGLGGLGSAMAEYLARLGVRDWVLVDPDAVELTNLNRLVNATATDAQKGRAKVNVARSTIHQANPSACVRPMQMDVFDAQALRALKTCDLLVVATDNHSSRMALNRLSAQYLIPLVHVGFNVTAAPSPSPNPLPLPTGGEGGGQGVGEVVVTDVVTDAVTDVVTDVSGEFAIPDLGRWCLQCAGIVDPQQAGWELASESQREVLRERGYVADTPAPAVRHLDGLVAALAAAEIHNLVHPFKPQQRYLTCDVMRAELLSLQVKPGEDCPVCSPDSGVLGLGDLEPLPDYYRGAQAMLPPPDIASRPSGSDAVPLALPEAVEPEVAEPEVVRAGRSRRLQTALDEPEGDW